MVYDIAANVREISQVLCSHCYVETWVQKMAL